MDIGILLRSVVVVGIGFEVEHGGRKAETCDAAERAATTIANPMTVFLLEETIVDFMLVFVGSCGCFHSPERNTKSMIQIAIR